MAVVVEVAVAVVVVVAHYFNFIRSGHTDRSRATTAVWVTAMKLR